MKRIAMIVGAAVSLALAAPALAQSPIVIKFSHVVAPNTPKGKGSAEVQGTRREVHQRQGQG